MTVIWGVWRRDGRPTAAGDLIRMEQKLCLRSLSKSGSWASDEVGLAVASAPTLPEADYDRQPLSSSADASVLVADLRLDNRRDLSRDLEIPGEAARCMADSALLQAAWTRWGEATLNRLVGDFAFVVWEPRHQRIVCARDHFGRAGLHYSVAHGLFAFATLPRGLHALPEIPREVDPAAVAMTLALLPTPDERTLFAGVKRLLPGHVLIASRDKIIVRPYWKLDTERRVTYAHDSDYVEAFRDIFDEAVRCRLRSRGPVGSNLSGGFDSSSVSATAARLLSGTGRRLTSFTSVPAAAFQAAAASSRIEDEGAHAASLARRHTNVRHILVRPLDECPLDLLLTDLPWIDSPGSHLIMLPSLHAMVEAVRDEGIKTVLIGVKGNLTISYDGLCLLPGLIGQGRWISWARESTALRRTRRLTGRAILRRSFGPFLPRFSWRRSRARQALEVQSVMNPALIDMPEIAEAPWWNGESCRRDGRKLRAAAMGRVDSGILPAGRPGMEDVDYRDPTADKRLVEFCLAIPEEQFLRSGETRFLLRRAMAGAVPSMILEERRKGLVGADWYLRIAPYRDRFAASVARMESSATARHCLDVPRMRQLIDHWPSSGWNSAAARDQYAFALCRGVAAGEFIRHVEETASC